MIPKRLIKLNWKLMSSNSLPLKQPLCHTDSTRSSGLLCLEASKHQLTPRFIGCKFENIYSKGHSQPRRHVYYHPMTQYEFCGLSLSRKSRVSSAALDSSKVKTTEYCSIGMAYGSERADWERAWVPQSSRQRSCDSGHSLKPEPRIGWWVVYC